MTEHSTAEAEEIWEPCPRCEGTGRAAPDSVAGLRTQGATMDSKVICPVCNGDKGKTVTRLKPSDEEGLSSSD